MFDRGGKKFEMSNHSQTILKPFSNSFKLFFAKSEIIYVCVKARRAGRELRSPSALAKDRQSNGFATSLCNSFFQSIK